MTDNFLLIIVIGIFGIFIYMGIRKGMVRTVFSLFSSVIVLVVTTVAAPALSNYARNNEKIFNAVRTSIEKSIEAYQNKTEADKESEKSEITESAKKEKKAEKENEDANKRENSKKSKKYDKKKKTAEEAKNKGMEPEEIDKLKDEIFKGISVPNTLLGGKEELEKKFLPENLIGELLKTDKVEEVKREIQKEVNYRVSMYLAGIAINSASFVIVYLILYIALKILEKVLDLISRLPVLNGLNRLGGGAAGLLKGLIAVWILFAVMTMFISNPLAREGIRQINENVFLSILYKYNIITRFIGL